jgi:hypothetical protein
MMLHRAGVNLPCGVSTIHGEVQFTAATNLPGDLLLRKIDNSSFD